MKRIHYASGAVLTGDAIAEVLVQYAAALAASNSAAEVHAPVRLETGEEGEAVMLLGPASQILAEQETSTQTELTNSEFVSELEERIAALGPMKAGYVRNGTEEIDDVDPDLL
ncbi:hypothetical protein [Leifsonia sp. NPDC080035]|uniref:Antitoxin n=1 Tax=Leifsonia sp. NPDC080035 TaxID=3143936 RepID=A0AAU7GHM2_9MICO